MSKSPLRLPLSRVDNLARRIIYELSPVCEPGYCLAAGSLRRNCTTVGDIELVVIPRLAASLIPDVPGDSLLELELNAWVRQGRLLKAGKNNGDLLKKYYIPALGYDFKLEINISSLSRWAVELAIKTGPADFSHRLVVPRNKPIRPGVYGLLPSNWRICNGWEVWEQPGNGATRQRVPFESERDFIEAVCGRWIEPRDRN